MGGFILLLHLFVRFSCSIMHLSAHYSILVNPLTKNAYLKLIRYTSNVDGTMSLINEGSIAWPSPLPSAKKKLDNGGLA
jgi:hypothetical protein